MHQFIGLRIQYVNFQKLEVVVRPSCEDAGLGVASLMV